MNTIRLHESLPALPWQRVSAVIDTAALTFNYTTILDRVHAVSPTTRGIAVVKADAYGHGIRPVAGALLGAGCRAFAVSCPAEAMALRALCTELCPEEEVDILILGYAAPTAAPLLAEHNILTALLSESHARALDEAARAAGVTIRVHAALDTGMNRIGYPAHTDREVAGTIESLATLPLSPSSGGGLVLDGLFSHFARADEDYDTELRSSDSLTMTQYNRYRQVLTGLVARGIRPRVCHLCNSAASVRFPGILPDGCLDAVRIGISLYGYGVEIPNDGVPVPTRSTDDPPALRPVMRLETVVTHVHELLPGETVGYGGTYAGADDKPRTLITLPIGYADGWLRAFSGAEVTVHTPRGDCKAPIVGRICMDQCMVDITDLPEAIRTRVTPRTPVTLFGADCSELEALSARAHTIPYELLCLITARVPRVFE